VTDTNQHAHPATAAVPFLAVVPFNGPILAAAIRAGEAFSKLYLAWQEELARFAAIRFDSANETGRKLLMCRDWAEAAKVQQEWAASAVNEFFDEPSRLVQIASKIGDDSTPPAVSGDEAAMQEGDRRHSA
jgi:hypothetical protein